MGVLMDLQQIEKIIELMKANDLAEFEIEQEGLRLAVKRRGAGEPAIVSAPAVMAPAPAAAAAAASTPGQPSAGAPEQKFLEIKSPIVGTFYRSPSPDAEPFVAVGQHVTPDTVVCIIEAMKVMNEIKAEVKGTIRKIMVDNATPVQFGQVLFLVEPN
jgi:acetyl-CoA carboxylase biotin carboxyl carrier protein